MNISLISNLYVTRPVPICDPRGDGAAPLWPYCKIHNNCQVPVNLLTNEIRNYFRIEPQNDNILDNQYINSSGIFGR